MQEDERSETGRESGEEDSTSDGYDQESSISFENDAESNSSPSGQEEQDWTDYIKRSTREAEGKIRTFNITSCIETQRTLNWRQAMRIASHIKRKVNWKGWRVESRLDHISENTKKNWKADKEMR